MQEPKGNLLNRIECPAHTGNSRSLMMSVCMTVQFSLAPLSHTGLGAGNDNCRMDLKWAQCKKMGAKELRLLVKIQGINFGFYE